MCVSHWFIDKLNYLDSYLCVAKCRVIHFKNTNSDLLGLEVINV